MRIIIITIAVEEYTEDAKILNNVIREATRKAYRTKAKRKDKKIKQEINTKELMANRRQKRAERRFGRDKEGK